MQDDNNVKQTKRILSYEDLVKLDNSTNVDPIFVVETQKLPSGEGIASYENFVKNDKYYLPRLNINNQDCYPQQEKLKYFTEKNAIETCTRNCCGIKGIKSACCILDPNDLEHVLGPLDEKWIKSIVRILRSKSHINVDRNDVVIDYEEGMTMGKSLFNDNPVFKDPKAYPIMRIQTMGPRYICKFANPVSGMCGIYPHRPTMCSTYYCSYVKANYLIKIPGTQNTFMRAK